VSFSEVYNKMPRTKSHSRKISRSQAATLLSITEKHLDSLVSRGILPCHRENRRVFFDQDAIVEAFRNRPNSKPHSDDLDAQRARLVRAKADTLQEWLKWELGKYVPLEDARFANGVITKRFYALMREFPDTAVKALRTRKATHPGAIQSSIRDTVYALLTDLVHICDNVPDPPGWVRPSPIEEPPEQVGDYATELQRLTRLQADKYELKLMLSRGELYDIAAETAKEREMIVNIRSRLLGLPSKFAMRFVGKSDAQRRAALEKEIAEVLTEWRHPAPAASSRELVRAVLAEAVKVLAPSPSDRV
jgi:phage terminase Nu1 subunit (DNA packaging protein)